MTLPPLGTLKAAAAIVHQAMPPTPQIRWPLLCARTGAEVWIKHENHTPLGAFKIRGGVVYMESLRSAEPKLAGVIAATRGNHGQSVAFAAARAGLRAVIVVPHGNSREKNAAMRALGAELVEHGDDFQEAYEYAAGMAEAQSLHFVRSFDSALISGVASYALELFEAVPDLDAIYVPIGMGSGICGAIAARNALGLKTEIVGVVAADDDEIRAAMRYLFSDTHNVAEGAGAAALAALLQERVRMRGRRVALILSGGNVDREVFVQALAQNLGG